MKVTDAGFVQSFIHMANDGWEMGWHEKNGGNLSYRIRREEIGEVSSELRTDAEWKEIGTEVPQLAGEYFLVTGTGKYFQNIAADPEDTLAITEVDESGKKYRICWGLINGGGPTSEFPTHLMNHEVKKRVSGGKQRVIYHAHPANIIALTFVLPLTDEAFTRQLWETMTECPIIFPEGIGVLPWMVPGGREIALATSKLMENYNAVVWAHHGLFCSGEDFDQAFGLMHAVEKAAEILVKVYSMTGGEKRQTMQADDFRALAKAYDVTLPERFLN